MDFLIGACNELELCFNGWFGGRCCDYAGLLFFN